MSARLEAIEEFQAWKADFDVRFPLAKRREPEREALRRRFEDFLDDLIAAHDLDAVDIDMAMWDELLAALDNL